MKKVFASIICCLLVLCTVFMTGCGYMFSGTFEAITMEQFQDFYNEIENSTEFQVDGGYSYTAKVKSTIPGQELDSKFSVKRITVDGQVQGKGNVEAHTVVSANSPAAELKLNFWYKDGVVYQRYDDDISGTMVKTKSSIDFDEYLLVYSLLAPIPFMSTTPVYYMQLANQLGAIPEILIAEENDLHKLKIRFSDHKVEDTNTTMTVIFVYDQNYDLIGMKFDMDLKSSDGRNQMSFLVEPWYTDINVPGSILDYTYVNQILPLA